MRAHWPEVLLAALFLAGDLFFSGTAADAAGAAAGVIAYLASVVSGRRKAALLVEGLVLSAIAIVARLISFPGGTFTLFEVALGAFLLLSGLTGGHALEAVTGSLARGMINPDESPVLSVHAGGAFLLHGIVSVLLTMFTGTGAFLRNVLLVPLFAVAIALASRRLGKLRKLSLPALEGSEGRMILTCGGIRLGDVRVRGDGTAAAVEVLEMEPDSLPLLETALARLGHRAVLITAWPHETLLLAMNGYAESGPDWRKMLRR